MQLSQAQLLGGVNPLSKILEIPYLVPMKPMHYVLTILCLSVVTAFGQTDINWKTQKNTAFTQTGITTEGHESLFSTLLFKDKGQFIEIEGGSGNFSPSGFDGQIFSSGLTYSKGNNNHFLTIGMHMTYASNEELQVSSILMQEAYLSKALIGYQYSAGKIDFKLRFQPLTGLSRRIANIGSSFSFHIRF
ncbi:MAG: hypothetical protein GQ574_11445 [Crocinitomix sp.]|nr:hypothetical protein [Crocinitomix sp.]